MTITPSSFHSPGSCDANNTAFILFALCAELSTLFVLFLVSFGSSPRSPVERPSPLPPAPPPGPVALAKCWPLWRPRLGLRWQVAVPKLLLRIHPIGCKRVCLRQNVLRVGEQDQRHGRSERGLCTHDMTLPYFLVWTRTFVQLEKWEQSGEKTLHFFERRNCSMVIFALWSVLGQHCDSENLDWATDFRIFFVQIVQIYLPKFAALPSWATSNADLEQVMIPIRDPPFQRCNESRQRETTLWLDGWLVDVDVCWGWFMLLKDLGMPVGYGSTCLTLR
jgi:hypothetical protein